LEQCILDQRKAEVGVAGSLLAKLPEEFQAIFGALFLEIAFGDVAVRWRF